MSKNTKWISEANLLKNVRKSELDVESKLKLTILLVIVHFGVLTGLINAVFDLLMSDNIIKIVFSMIFVFININLRTIILSGENIDHNGFILVVMNLFSLIIHWVFTSLYFYEVSIHFVYVIIITIIIANSKLKRYMFSLCFFVFIIMIYIDILNPIRHGVNTVEYINVVFGTLIVGIMISLIVSQYQKQLKMIRIKLYDHTIKDPLTDVYNVRQLNIELNKYIGLWKSKREIFSLAIIDLDDFKAINDNYGHRKGDELLVDFAEFIKLNIRPEDIMFRYGGDEFIVLFPNIDSNKSREIMESFAEELVANIKVSFSVGLSDSSELVSTDECDDIIKHADAKLYKAKLLGKNQLVN